MGPMQGWRITPLSPDVRLERGGSMPALPPDLEAEIAAIWAAASSRHPALFNGRVFCADLVTPDRIVGHWSEYRRVLARMRDPGLRARLPLRSLAVNGLLECADGLVLGQRHDDAVYLPGAWQAAPAGAVELRQDGRQDAALDLRGQLMAELYEELGVPVHAVDRVVPVLAIEHRDSGIVDVGFLMRTPLGFDDVERLWRAAGNAEYQALRLIGRDGRSLPEPGALLPSAQALIRRWTEGSAG